jgi:hypothetical protein
LESSCLKVFRIESINDLRGEQRRQLIDTQQVFDTWRQTHQEAKRLAGGMRWGKRNGTEYLNIFFERSGGPKLPLADEALTQNASTKLL